MCAAPASFKTSISLFELTNRAENTIKETLGHSIPAEDLAERYIPNFQKPDAKTTLDETIRWVAPAATRAYNFFAEKDVPDSKVTEYELRSLLKKAGIKEAKRPLIQEHDVYFTLAENPNIHITYSFAYYGVSPLTDYKSKFVFSLKMEYEDERGESSWLVNIDTEEGPLSYAPAGSNISEEEFVRYLGIIRYLENDANEFWHLLRY